MQFMEADIYTRYDGDFYRIVDFKCRCKSCKTSKPEYSESFSISFVRKGNFLFNVFRHSLDSYTGCILVTKPGYERTVTHTHAIPDECTIFDFKNDFYREILEHYGKSKFFKDDDLHSALVKTSPEMELLHFQALNLIMTGKSTRLLIDNIVMEIISLTLGSITEYTPNLRIHTRLKENHLLTIERAKEYIIHHFSDDISLMDIADYCNVSPFHFSRIFKTFTSYSPHQFLLATRLKNSELMLKNTVAPITDVAFSSGFNSIEHFTAAFSQKYNCPPAKFRAEDYNVLLS